MFDLKKAIELAEICQTLYDEPEKFIAFNSWFCEKDNSRFCVVEKSDYFVFAFCGTNDIKDLLQDVRYIQNDSGIHSGFYDHWELTAKETGGPEMEHAISANKKIYLTGHSLGAAVATIWAQKLTRYENMELYTFGSPRVGDLEFFQSITTPHYRIVNGIDVVTNLPPAHLPINQYKHHGQLVRIDYKKLLQFDDPSFWDGLKDATYGLVNDIVDRDIWPDNIEDHFLENYIDGLKANL